MIIGIIQARMSSRRLPGKVMEMILGKPMIERLMERVLRSSCVDKWVIATSLESSDNILANYSNEMGWNVFRGSQDDVVDRMYRCAKSYSAKHIARITADCPLLDPIIVDLGTKLYLTSAVDYLANDYGVTSFPDGMDFEIFSMNALERVWNEAVLPSDREHVVSYIRRNNSFKKKNLLCDKDLSIHRLTVDEPIDLVKARKIFEALYFSNKCFSVWDIVEYLEKNQFVRDLNRHIARNEGYLYALKSKKKDGWR